MAARSISEDVTVSAYANLEVGSDNIQYHAIAPRVDAAGARCLGHQNGYWSAAGCQITASYRSRLKGGATA
jgi:hypothetical protein